MSISEQGALNICMLPLRRDQLSHNQNLPHFSSLFCNVSSIALSDEGRLLVFLSLVKEAVVQRNNLFQMRRASTGNKRRQIIAI